MKKGLCISELVVIVAITGILIAIATPRFLEAQKRKQVTQTYSDLRTNALALEAYATDHEARFPPRGLYDRNETEVIPHTKFATILDPIWLTTPVAYITTENPLIDPYQSKHYDPTIIKSGSNANQWAMGRYRYTASRQSENSPATEAILIHRYGEWRLLGSGPDTYVFNTSFDPPSPASTTIIPYDATNGTISIGDIGRSQREVEITLGATVAVP